MKQTGKDKTVVAIDIGNTAVSYGVWKRGRFIRTGFLCQTQLSRSTFLKIFGRTEFSADVIVSSVVPKVTRQLKRLVRAWSPTAQIYVVGENVRVRTPLKYAWRHLGADRIVNVYGAAKFYRLPALVIDFGTAITFDYISGKGVFEGGLIVPGIESSLQGLLDRTALLPKLKRIVPYHGFIGHTTTQVIMSGVLNGFGALADGLIERFQAQFGRLATVVATGGHARMIASYSRRIKVVDPLHTLKSLVAVYGSELR